MIVDRQKQLRLDAIAYIAVEREKGERVETGREVQARRLICSFGEALVVSTGVRFLRRRNATAAGTTRSGNF